MKEKSTILYLDDEQENLDAFYSIFRRDYNVLTTTNPSEAMNMLQSHVVKIIISDQRMPNISGVEFLKNTISQNPRPSRILLTGYADMNAVVSAINEGRIFMYVSKPWNESELREQLNKAIEQYETNSEQQFLLLRLKECNQLLEEKVSLRTKSLLEVNSQLHSFMKVAAHDLKNPLTGIRSSAEILAVRGVTMSPEKQRHHAEGIVDSADRMLGIISSILEDSKRHQGAFKPLMDAVDVREIVLLSIKDNQIHAEQKKIRVVFDNDTGVESIIWADRLAVQQILDNLLSNAVKFSQADTTVHVRILSNNETRKVMIAVEDEGPGISKEDQKELFKEYSQLTARPTGGEGSTGLGLSIAQSFVQSMSGRVWCESELGKGSTFIVEFNMPS